MAAHGQRRRSGEATVTAVVGAERLVQREIESGVPAIGTHLAPGPVGPVAPQGPSWRCDPPEAEP